MYYVSNFKANYQKLSNEIFFKKINPDFSKESRIKIPVPASYALLHFPFIFLENRRSLVSKKCTFSKINIFYCKDFKSIKNNILIRAYKVDGGGGVELQIYC